jgi:uncharacterized protein (DUF433 family)
MATTLDWSQCSAVESVSDRLSGAWVLKDTRLPVSAIFENLEAGSDLDEIVEQFHVDPKQVKAVLEFACFSGVLFPRAPSFAPGCSRNR